jgi:hypothetical protein
MRAQTPINGRCRFPLHRHDHNASNAEFIHRARKISVAQKSVQKFAANPRGYFLMVMRAPHVGHISDRPGKFRLRRLRVDAQFGEKVPHSPGNNFELVFLELSVGSRFLI